MKSLFTPWRYSYLLEDKQAATGCIFCKALADENDAETLVVFRGSRNFIILNRYPYANGHVMIVPNDHVASPSDSDPEQRAELFDLATACEAALRETYRADGINMGLNLGKAAGAGVAGHYHMHVLPRWEGDTNFMAVTAEIRIIPEDLVQTRERLRLALQHKLGPHASRVDA